MPIDRYYIDTPLETGLTVSLSDTEFHHMTRVVRLKVGEEAELVNGNGTLATATLQDIQKKEAILTIQNVHTAPKPPHALILAQALPRLNRLDTIVEKVTELGATEIWLFPGNLSERKDLTDHQIARLKAITIAALKQSGRLWLPKLEIKPPLTQWKPLPYSCYFGDMSKEAASLGTALANSQDTLILIGPESGLTEAEEHVLQHLQFQGVKLSDNILRSDTAALMAVGIVSHFRQVRE